MKYCSAYAALLDAFFDGECTSEEAQQVRAHLAECPGCRAYLEELQTLRDSFPSLEEIEVPDGFADAVCAAVRANAAPRKSSVRRWVRTIGSAVACLAVIFVLYQSGNVAFTGSGNAAAASSAAGVSEPRDAIQYSESVTTQDQALSPAVAGTEDQESQSNSSHSFTTSKNEISSDVSLDSCRRTATVAMTSEQQSRLLGDIPAQAGNGCTLYVLEEDAYLEALNRLVEEGLSVDQTENENAEDALCCLCVYLEN